MLPSFAQRHSILCPTILSLSALVASAAEPLELRFNTAATDWSSQALPIGNGRMGAMIYGSPLAERMQFNEITLWTGGANLSGNYDINTFGAYQNFGDVYLEEPGSESTAVTWPTAATHAAASADQGVEKSVDGDAASKWCFEHLNKTVIWQAAYAAPQTFGGYSFTSAGDVAARDPQTWTFEGSNDGTTWTQLDSRALSGTTTPVWPFPSRGLKVNFTPASTGSFRFYRFVFTPNVAVPHFQVAEITLNPTNVVGVTNPSYADHAVPASNQLVEKSVDGSVATKWCVVHQNKPLVWQSRYSAPLTITGYSLSSADDVPERDPRTWTLEGSADGNLWTLIDSRTLSGTSTPVWPFPSRQLKVNFNLPSPVAYAWYRFVFAPSATVPHFQVSEIKLNEPPAANVPTNLIRSLDIANSTHRTTWTRDGINYARESIASHPHQVIATRFTADQPGKITTRIRLAGAHGETATASGNEVAFAGALTNNGLRYATRVRVLNTGGTLTVSGNTLLAENCDSLVILHAAATDYAMDATTTPTFRNGINPSGPVQDRLNAAAALGYDAIKTAHLADFHALFDRVTLNLGTAPANSFTNTRLNAYKAGGVDRHLEQLLFQYGRYLMISSSRDSLPANLQGLWNNSNTPPWNSDYHVNINLQMNYWLNGPANLAECQQPLFNYLKAIRPLSIAATKASFGATTPGWTMRTSVNPFGGHGWNWDTPSSGWLARHYWDQYAFTGDTAFLQNTAWPVMKEICQFWLARLVPDSNGKLVAPAGWSPEHGPVQNGVSYVQEIVWELFTHTIAAADVLGNDATFRAQLADARSRLLVPAIGPAGQITEWADPATEASIGYGMNGGHRHTSHLYGLYPSSQFNSTDTPAYVAAGKLSLLDRGTSGDSRQSWTWPWRTALWARMGEPEKAYEMVRGLPTYNTFSNLFCIASGVFQMDGNFGYPAAVSEMLVQSQSGEIAILPALPAAWANGSFTGIGARGGFEVDAAWQNGLPVSLTVRSAFSKPATLRLPATLSSPGAFIRSGDTISAVTRKNGRLTFPTAAGSAYAIDTNVTGTDDNDHDGFNTYQEWLAGTDPAKADSKPQVRMARSGESFTLTWDEIPDRHYTLQSSSDLTGWTEVLSHLSTGAAMKNHTVIPSGNRFYRVVIRETTP